MACLSTGDRMDWKAIANPLYTPEAIHQKCADNSAQPASPKLEDVEPERICVYIFFTHVVSYLRKANRYRRFNKWLG